MNSIYEPIRSLINRNMVSTAATTLDEKEFNISSAISSIIPSLLAVMLKKGETPQMKNILEEAGNLNILTGTDRSWNTIPTEDQQRIGDDFLQHLLGDKAADFTDPIAEKSGATKVATNKLVSMIAPIVSGFLGNKIVNSDWTLSRILKEIDQEKNSFTSYIPSDLIKAFGLSSVLNTNTNAATTNNKKSYTWVIILIVVVLIIILIFGWRSCRNNDARSNNVQGVAMNDTISQTRLNAASTATATNTAAVQRDTEQLTLPNGNTITVYEDGVEKEMLDYLQSDDYREATDEDLQDKWFQFDNIAFEFGSSTDLKPESRVQLQNIVAILNNYKDARIKIAGFADKRGTDEANMQVSRERAKTIETLLENAGVGAQVARTQGYGDEYAKHSADASNETRAEDRDIALRFVK